MSTEVTAVALPVQVIVPGKQPCGVDREEGWGCLLGSICSPISPILSICRISQDLWDLYRTSGLFLCVFSVVNCSLSGKLDVLFYLSLPYVFYFIMTSTEFQNGLFYIGSVCYLLMGCIHMNKITVY